MRIALPALALSVLVFAGCGSTSACNASTCTGCCTADGFCQGGDQVSSCGTLGNACGVCLAGQQCVFGGCTFVSPGAGGGTAGGDASGGGMQASGGGMEGTGGGMESTGGGTSATGGGSAQQSRVTVTFTGSGAASGKISLEAVTTRTCTASCVDDGVAGRTVVVRAIASPDAAFVGFTGPCTSSTERFICRFEAGQNVEIRAQFAALTGRPTGGTATTFASTSYFGSIYAAPTASGGAVLVFNTFNPITVGSQSVSGNIAFESRADGSVVWVKAIDLGTNGRPSAVIADAAGSTFVAGACGANARPAGTVIAAGGCLVRLVAGAITTATSYGNAAITDLALDASGNLALGGSVTGSFVPNAVTLTRYGPATTSGSDGFALVVHPDGTAVWGARFGGPYDDGEATVTFDSTGRLLVGGHVRSSFSFGGTSFAGGQFAGDGYLARFSATGVLDKAIKLDSQYETFVTDLAEAGGHVYLVGTYSGTSYFASLPVAPAITGTAFVGAFDDQLAAQWFVPSQYIYDPRVSASGTDIVVAGHYESGGNWGLGWHIGGAFSSNAVIAGFAPTGSLKWSTNIESGLGLPQAIYGPTQLVVAGVFDGTLPYGTRPTSDGNNADLYLAILPR